VRELFSKVFEGEDDDEASGVLEKIKKWYNGYIVDGMRVYNPLR
jgi:hypothetical protein